MKNEIQTKYNVNKDMTNILIRSISAAIVILFSYGSLSAQVVIRPDDRDDYAKAINEQFNKGNWEEGKKSLDAGLAKYPKDSDLKMLAGKYYHHKKQYDKARYELNKSLEQNPDNVAAKQVLVNVEMESGRYSSAICYVNELLEVNPYWRGLWRKKIELYELQGNIVEANRLRKRLAQIYPEDSDLQNDFLYNTEIEANIKRKEGKIEDAIALSEALVKEQPRNADYQLTLINDFLKAGDKASALAYTERGLSQFPGNMDFVNKKVGILAEQKRYEELLAFLQEQRRIRNSAELQRQYSYYLQEAAQEAKGKDPLSLYGKILDGSPGNEEAFNYVFNALVANHDYDEALRVLNAHRRARGNSKNLALKELMLYERMGNTGRVTTLTKELFAQYPNDTDIRDAYVKIKLNEAKSRMAEEEYAKAIADWHEVIRYGDEDTKRAAQNSLFNAYLLAGDYNNALGVLNEMIEREPRNPDLLVKRSDVYLKQKRYQAAQSTYEQVLNIVSEEQRPQYLKGYADMNSVIVKELNEQYRYNEAKEYVEKWLEYDPDNLQALKYAVNLSYSTKKYDDMREYAERGAETYPDEMFFKIKLAELSGAKPANYAETYETLHEELLESPYHKELIGAFEQLSVDYSKSLIKNKESAKALVILDTALRYAPDSRELKYMKGVAFEKLHQFDSAYYYQSFYDPAPLELEEFKQQLYYLSYKGYKNEIGLQHLRSRFGDDYSISTISGIEYTRHEGRNAFTGRANYAGRMEGRGVQIQGEWTREWNEKTRSMINAAWANRFFPLFAANASIYRDFNILDGIEAELGIGYRRLNLEPIKVVYRDTVVMEPQPRKNLWNLVLGATKELDPWRFNVRLNNFLLDGKWLFNLSGNARYNFMSPRNYVVAMGSIGSSPNVDMINYQGYGGFHVLNTMVGAGVGRMLTKTISLGVLGTWDNYRVEHTLVENEFGELEVPRAQEALKYRNLYTIYLNLNVVF
ncbi:MAG: tetratricopeptide repeat protein [Bacteroidetes bacterium]|nr:tetratricopeptide repeat protein [Bacteroidota bacterium]